MVLYPGDGEWECDCAGRFDACEHVAAAVIALGQDGLDPAAATELFYRLERSGERLYLRRTVVAPGGSEVELRPRLFSIASGRAKDPGGELRPNQADLEVNRMVGQNRGRTPVTGGLVGPLLSALAGCERVTLDGRQVAVSGEPVLPRGSVTDRKDGVRLAVVADPMVGEVVGDRMAMVRGVLHPLGHADVAGERWELLPLVRDYATHELGELVTQMLPALRKDIAIEVRSTRLPRATREARPRIQLDVSGDGNQLSVLPTLVYGDPALARIDGDRMVQLKPPAPVRDRRAELALVTSLRDALNMVPGRRVTATGAEARGLVDKVRAFQRGDDPGRTADALHDVELVPRLVVGDVGDLAGDARGEPGGGAAPGATMDFWFETSEAVGGEVRRASGAAVVAAWQSGLDLLPLEGGGWAPLPADFLARHGQRVLALLAARGEGGRVGAVSLPALLTLCDEMKVSRPAAAGRLSALFDEQGRIPAATLPADLTATLRPYQQAGVDWLALPARGRAGRACSPTTWASARRCRRSAAIRAGERSLVVARPACSTTGQAELRPLPARAAASPSTTARAGRSTRSADVTLTSYALLRLDAEALGATSAGTRCVLDEAQAIKNPDSQVGARRVRAASAASGVALTGTPVENRLEELWSLLPLHEPGPARRARRLRRALRARRSPTATPGAAAGLRERIRPFVLRRLKRDVAPELPPRTDARPARRARPTASARSTTRSAPRPSEDVRRAARRRRRQGRPGRARGAAAAAPGGVPPGARARPVGGDARRRSSACVEALETRGRRRATRRWSSRSGPRLLDLVEPHLRARRHRASRASTDRPRDRGRRGERASRTTAGPPVLLVSLKAGGTGLNLTAADHVFLLDPWWNPAVEDQAADRAHRIGQDRPVMVYRLVARDTVEERHPRAAGQKARAGRRGARATRSAPRRSPATSCSRCSTDRRGARSAPPARRAPRRRRARPARQGAGPRSS